MPNKGSLASTERQNRRILRRGLEEKRAQAIRLIEAGTSPDVVAGAFSCGRSTVYGWWATYQEIGEAAFVVRRAKGATPKLTKRQTTQLAKWILGKDPRQLQFDYALWTREMVRQLIAERFSVEMTRQGVGVLLHRLGLSPERPLVRAYEQDPERVRAWKQEEYPAIRQRAKVAGAKIFFQDEAGMRTDHHAGTTWGEVGHTPVVRGTGQRKSLNMISAVSAQGKLHFTFVEGKVNAEAFVSYLKKLLHDVRGPIFLICDGHPAHKAGKTKQFVASTKGRLELFFLPPYSPELNPDEWVWKNVKSDHVGKMAVRNLEEMRSGIEKAPRRSRLSR